MPQLEEEIGTVRVLPAVSIGPLNVPAGFRVSRMRHGAIATYVSKGLESALSGCRCWLLVVFSGIGH